MNSIPTFQAWIEADIKKEKFGRQPNSLYEPIRYIMGLQGKRLRPLLTLFAYSLYQKDTKRIVKYANAVEAFHNFTLMHDDIMDQAPLRRGKETVHKKWNVNTAIVSGDVMLVKVYEVFLSLPPAKASIVLNAFNQCVTEVCEGQQWDMEFEQEEHVTVAQYISMIRQKTAVLLGFSLELGAIMAEASGADRVALRKFGINMGIGFQLKDDYLDVYGDKTTFGKQVGGDIIANKKTFLLITALSMAKGKTKKELNHWLSARRFSKKEKVAAVSAIYDKLQIQKITQSKIKLYFNKGLKSLDQISTMNSKKIELRALALSLIDRKS